MIEVILGSLLIVLAAAVVTCAVCGAVLIVKVTYGELHKSWTERRDQ